MTRRATTVLIAGLVLSLIGVVSNAQSPELYIVQPSDTLESIADKAVGDPVAEGELLYTLPRSRGCIRRSASTAERCQFI